MTEIERDERVAILTSVLKKHYSDTPNVDIASFTVYPTSYFKDGFFKRIYRKLFGRELKPYKLSKNPKNFPVIDTDTY